MRVFVHAAAVDEIAGRNHNVGLLRQSQDRINAPLEQRRTVDDSSRQLTRQPDVQVCYLANEH